MNNEETEQEVTTVSTAERPTQVVTKTKKVIKPDIRTEPPQKVYEKKKTIFRTYQIIWYIVGVIEVLLAFRILLKFIGANPISGFTQSVYALSDPLALPFRGIVSSAVQGNIVVEWSTLIAMVVYLILAWGVVELLQFLKPVTPQEVEEGVSTE